MEISVEANFGGVLDAAPDAMLVVDQQGRIVLANTQCEHSSATSRRATGQKIEVLVPPRFRAKHPGHRSGLLLPVILMSGRWGVGLELYGLRKNGSEFPVEISLSPLERRRRGRW